MSIDVLITEDLDAPAVRRLAEQHQVVAAPTLWKDPAKFRAAIADVRCVMIRNQTQLGADVLSAAKELLAIGRFGVGLDNIDLRAASELGIVVIAPLDANAVSVAEVTMGLIISLARKIPQADRSTKAGQWDRRGCTGIELHGKTLTICGFGRIGRLVAARARAFGMPVIVFDPFIKNDAPELRQTEARLVTDLPDALREGDFVSAHLPLTANTKRIFNAQAFAAMKRGAFFINTSRGGVIEESALLAALQSGHLGGAALDVRDVEPPTQPNPFSAMENVILTPHIGSFTTEAQTRTFEAVCADVDAILRGQPARNFVNFAQPRRVV